MRIWVVFVAVIVINAAVATPVLAQRFTCERSFDVTGTSILDVSTVRGKIEIATGEPGRVVVIGMVTVRVDWNVPANVAELAHKVAASPPLQQDGQTIRLRVPADPADQRAVTVSYQVRVPPNTRVLSVSESGATSVRGVSGAVAVRTQSGAVELTRLGAGAEVTTGSGSVTIDGVSDVLTVTTSSSGVVGRSLGGSVHVRTASGSVDAELTGEGNADVETRSSAVRIRGARGTVNASSQSGRVSVAGVPNRPWTAHSGSGGVDVSMDTNASFSLDATSGSGSVRVDGAMVRGSVSKRRATGDIGAGGPLVRAGSRSGAVRITVAPRGRSSRSSPTAPGTRGYGEATAVARPVSTDRSLSVQLAFNDADGLHDR